MVEHSLGKGEVESSILSCSTIHPLDFEENPCIAGAFAQSDVTKRVTKRVPEVARKVRYLLERDGRYYARLVVPVHLRSYLEGKTELRLPLGADYREATKAIHGAVADLQFKIKQAEVRAADAGVAPRSAAPFELSAEQMALRLY